MAMQPPQFIFSRYLHGPQRMPHLDSIMFNLLVLGKEKPGSTGLTATYAEK